MRVIEISILIRPRLVENPTEARSGRLPNLGVSSSLLPTRRSCHPFRFAPDHPANHAEIEQSI